MGDDRVPRPDRRGRRRPGRHHPGPYDTDIAGTCVDARSCQDSGEYALILLDVILTDARGDELCSAIRSQCATPIIFMSCMDDSDTIITALKNGGARAPDSVRRFRRFSIDTLHHRVVRNGQEVVLSSIKYALLLYMTEHPDTLLLYSERYERVWDSDSLGNIRTVMVHISNLRKKIDPEHAGIIETVRGAGYIFTDI